MAEYTRAIALGTARRRGHTGLVVTGLLTAALAISAVGVAPAAKADTGLGYDPLTTKGSLLQIADVVGARASWAAGYTGKGIGVALIDTGVAEVPGLTSGNVWQGPAPSLRGVGAAGSFNFSGGCRRGARRAGRG